MLVFEGSQDVPIIFSAHHASSDFGEFSDRVALTPEQCTRFSDYGTEHTVATNGLSTLVAIRSRALGDLNRNPDDDGRFQTQDYHKVMVDGQWVYQKHDIWLPGQELTAQEKTACQNLYHDAYHNKILDLLKERDRPTFVVAWDNTANYSIGNDEDGNVTNMPQFVLSNRAHQGDASEPFDESGVSCDPVFMHLLADYFRETLESAGLPTDVMLNLVYKGGYICRRYSTLRNQDELAEHGVTAEVQSLQLEYNTAITHDQETLEFYEQRAVNLKAAFSKAIKLAYENYRKGSL